MAAFQSRPGRYSIKVRLAPGPEGRPTRALPAGLTKEQADERDATLARLIPALRAAGQESLIERVVDELVTCSQEEWPRLVSYVESKLVTGVRAPIRDLSTVQQIGERWTSGALALQYPDHIKKKTSSKDDRIRLERYVYPHIGDLPMEAVTLDHVEAVMGAIPANKSAGTRRQIAQVLRRLLGLAVYPLRILAVQPIPRGFLPKPTKAAFFWLYPTEEVLLLGDKRIPIERRLAYGILCREGMRASDLAGLVWEELDLVRGVINLGVHKTSAHTGARSWVLRPDTAEALRWWRQQVKGRGQVLPISLEHLAVQLRRDLGRLPVRRELVVGQAGRRRLRGHDLRGSFVTVALAQGKSEAWVTDRTGHTTSSQLAAYKRAARSAAELHLGDWRPLLGALPETASTPKPVYGGGNPTPSGSLRKRLQKEILAAVRKEGLEPPRREASEPKFSPSPLSLANLRKNATRIFALQRPGDTQETAPLCLAEGWL